MAKKRASRKPRGTDEGGRPINLSKHEDLLNEFRRQDKADTRMRGIRANSPEQMGSKQFSRANAQYKVAERNIQDVFKNRRLNPFSKPIALPSAKSNSVLEDMKSFMRSSAKTAFKGVGRSGGGRPGTRL